MNWNSCFSQKRLYNSGRKQLDRHRSSFSRDSDRIIFSNPFRRLQDKTQIFSLPGSAFVHNRLTHSLEVAVVGRSLGSITGEMLIQKEGNKLGEEARYFYLHDLSSVIYAACLCHDIGNPAFGHSGEDAICAYFEKNKNLIINGQQPLQSHFSATEWNDLVRFEGNANAIRVLAGKRKGYFPAELNLTVTTLATIAKYPCDSTASTGRKGQLHRKKFGFLQTEKQIFSQIADELGMIPESKSPLIFKRHPFVFLLEAADDICYNLVDLEDAARLGILPYEVVKNLLIALLWEDSGKGIKMQTQKLEQKQMEPQSELSYLRSKCIGKLIEKCSLSFINHRDEIIRGEMDRPLLKTLSESLVEKMNQISELSIQKIYNSDSVIRMEIAGYRIFSELLNVFIPAVIKNEPSFEDQKIIHLLPETYRPINSSSHYEKTIYIIDYLSSLTDDYALELYRNISGIELPRH